jgi:hypothetical protein
MMNNESPMEGKPADTLNLPAYLAVALVSGSILAYELFVMRVFANGGWSHFGSTVVSIAMFGFGVFSTVLCIWKELFKKRLTFWTNCSLLLLGLSMVAANSVAQKVPFNPIFLVSDPNQRYYLALYFLLYFLPFLLGAMFLGLFFIAAQKSFGKAYFANMTGSGLGGLALFGAMYWLLPARLFLVPVALWAIGSALWFQGRGRKALVPLLGISVAVSVFIGFNYQQINVSPYKGVSYARNFPDSKRVYQSVSPFGYLEVYRSSYFHFAPGLSDAASLYLDEMPENAYLGMFIDGDGPIGIMKDLPKSQTEYIKFLPMSMPYLLKTDPSVLVLQFGGGISTNVALKMGARQVTVAEGNPMIIKAARDNAYISGFDGHILDNPKVKLIPEDGRLYVGQARGAFDMVDLSLADSTGLSMPGGFSIYEKYSYTKETFVSCMRALKQAGLLAVTVWNKEDPPKSTLKLLSTLIAAADAEGDPKTVGRDFFIAHTYLSTLSVLYKIGGFDDAEVGKLMKYCKRMNFEVVYFPGQPPVKGSLGQLFDAFRNAYFAPQKNDALGDNVDMTATNLYRMVASRFMQGDFKTVGNGYVFNSEPLTNDRPYFAGFVKLKDIPRFMDKLETISDEWGYLLLWATLILSLFFGSILMLLPVIFGWRAFFSGHRGKLSIILFFTCLGIGYILVEIAMISKYVLCLGNTTVSVTVLITGMLVFSGLGSYASERFVSVAGATMAVVCIAISAILVLFAFCLDPILGAVGWWPYGAKILFCLALLFPVAFLMGFPFALGMATLSRLNKEHFFVWAWGINGSFSVVGSVLVPILSVIFGISSAIMVSAAVYLIALPAFLSLRIPDSVG